MHATRLTINLEANVALPEGHVGAIGSASSGDVATFAVENMRFFQAGLGHTICPGIRFPRAVSALRPLRGGGGMTVVGT